MKSLLRYLFVIVAFLLECVTFAQSTKWRDIYKVKKKDTIFSIAKQYGLTVPELMDANPDMKKAGYELKKDDYVFIPYVGANVKPKTTGKSVVRTDIRTRAIRVGVMLPLHNADGDGRRMVEYYRGVLMACDSLKRKGISTDVYAWNVAVDMDIRTILMDKKVKDCDLIFGPLYTSQVQSLSTFCKTNGIKLVIPFSISGDVVAHNPQVFQVYQSTDMLNTMAINAFLSRFSKHHPVFIDCNDPESSKGTFTSGLRNQLDRRGVKYSITNLRSSEENFSKAFSRVQPNVVILNTARSPELNVAIAKINGLTVNVPGVVVSLFGYTEWLMYTKYNLNNFFKFDTYIPTTFYYNPLSAATRNLENSYRRWFGTEMLYALPHFAIIGYDQAQFFLQGLHRYGTAFNGLKGENVYRALQSPMNFKRVGTAGGMQNSHFMLIHYTYNHTIESITY